MTYRMSEHNHQALSEGQRTTDSYPVVPAIAAWFPMTS